MFSIDILWASKKTQFMLAPYKNSGYLVPFIVLLSLMLIQFTSNFLTQNENFYRDHEYPKAIGFLIAALALYQIDQFLNSKQKRIKNNLTGQEIIFNEKVHSFFFIPMKYWAMICLIISAVTFMYEVIN